MAFSLVIPALNEADRLPPYLAEVRSHLDAQFADYEVIVVDDGSTDGLGHALEQQLPSWPQLKMIRHSHNQGKGAAVRTGMLAARGTLRLFADADGATPISEEIALRAALQRGADVAVGSRLIAADDVARRRTWGRAIIGRGFSSLARRLLPVPVLDTQCGFKMFRGEPGQRLFELARENGFLFDLELLMIADRLGCRVVEVPINWSDKPGSRLNLRREWWKILAGLWRLRRRRASLGLCSAEHG